mgnify:CR=1 FL=1
MILFKKYLVILLMAGVVSLGYWIFGSYSKWNWEVEASNTSSLISAGREYYSLLDGTRVKNKAAQTRRVVAVMVDNHPAALPQSGLSRAKIVYEVMVEGEMTRFMAIFDSAQKGEKIGPIRSARPYFLDWLKEYGDAMYIHSGGSPEALNLLSGSKIFDFNEFSWEKSFWRSEDRSAPHNLYTKSEFLKSPLEERAKKGPPNTPSYWTYARISNSAALGANKEFTIKYNPYYSVTWKYDKKAANYVRYVNGEKYADLEGGEVRAQNVVMQYVLEKTVDKEGRLQIITIGSGEAKIAKKGKLAPGTWKKKSTNARTLFYDKNGRENVFVPGNTWIEVVPKETVIEVTN